MSGSVVINFSGHSLSSSAKKILEGSYDTVLQATPIEFDFAADPEPQLESIISELPFKLDGTFPLTIVPPGQATLAILLTTYIHGLTGHFPGVCYLERGSGGVFVPRVEFEIDINRIRSAGRRYRARQFNV